MALEQDPLASVPSGESAVKDLRNYVVAAVEVATIPEEYGLLWRTQLSSTQPAYPWVPDWDRSGNGDRKGEKLKFHVV